MTTAKTPTKMNLIAKLAEITGKLAHIEKLGKNKAQNYTFARESDVAAAASGLFAEYNVFVSQSMVSQHDTAFQYETRSGSKMYLTNLTMEYTFHDGDSDQTIGPLRFPGAGSDTGDKGVYKAMTGATKYFLMKTFLVATGDDPEADEKVDKAGAGAAAGKGSKVKGGKAKAGTQKGGKTDGITKTQMTEISRLIKDKGISQVGFLAVVTMVVDGDVDHDANVAVKALSSEDAGKVVKALNELNEVETTPFEETAASGAAEEHDGDSEGMSIV
jgi:hypothetical protein